MNNIHFYSSLGTSNKRAETERDHQMLRTLMKQRWITIRDFSKKSVDEIQDLQFKRIQELVRHAFDTVPLYHDKYSEVNFQPDDLKTWDDFRKLPLLDKDELIASFPEKSISRLHDTEFTTRSTGSSGRFVTLAVSPNAIYLDTIQGARQFYFQSGGNYFPLDLALFIYTCPWWFSSINGEYPTNFLSTTTTKVKEAIKNIEETRPKILSVYPTYLKEIAKHNPNLKESGIELIVVHSEQSALKERLAWTEQFGIPVLDEFSSEELTRIALECPFRRYHLEEDACFIEIVDPESKKPVGHGTNGLVVGTNLLNEATPIIRYSQGDLATIVGQQDCGCGGNFRVMESPHGRYMDSIVTKEGEIIPASCFMDLAYNWYLELDVPVHGLRYQIVQNRLDTINVFLIEGTYQLSQAQKSRIRESLYQLLPRETTVSVNLVDQPPIDTGTKYRPVISLCNRGKE